MCTLTSSRPALGRSARQAGALTPPAVSSGTLSAGTFGCPQWKHHRLQFDYILPECRPKSIPVAYLPPQIQRIRTLDAGRLGLAIAELELEAYASESGGTLLLEFGSCEYV